MFRNEFIEIATKLSAVVACRCSPTQKADVARFIREFTRKRVCCIGDGGNDVSMIQAADVGESGSIRPIQIGCPHSLQESVLSERKESKRPLRPTSQSPNSAILPNCSCGMVAIRIDDPQSSPNSSSIVA